MLAPSSNCSLASQRLTPEGFAQLQAILQDFVATLPQGFYWDSRSLHAQQRAQVGDCAIAIAAGFQLLLLGRTSAEYNQAQSLSDPHHVSVQFGADSIHHYCQSVGLPVDYQPVLDQLSDLSLDPALVSQFSNLLITAIAVDHMLPAPQYPAVSVCQPLEQALHWQEEQDRLISQVSAQIRLSLDLSEILTTTIREIRQLLNADRTIIYQFKPECLDDGLDQTWPLYIPCQSYITYEDRRNDALLSVLDPAVQPGLLITTEEWQRFQRGETVLIDTVSFYQERLPEQYAFYERVQVRSVCKIPILVQGRIWGLLVAHQCHQDYRWQPRERDILQHLAEHLSIAIYQAQLYSQLQDQTQTLENRVLERTQELIDALALAQAANAAKGEFLATMSHELRTPLTCVIGMSSTLLRWAFGPLTERQREYIKAIHDSGEHLLELINDILDLSQIEAGKAALQVRPFSLSRLATQTLNTLQEKARLGDIHLLLDLQLNNRIDVFRADPKRLRQILINLLSNAVKFTEPQGMVSLRVWREGDRAVFQVSDTGIGIPESEQSHLFQKFQQLDTSIRRQYGGTGLGLALTKQLVELHGGHIQVESSVGQGSTFTVWIPEQSVPALIEAEPSLSHLPPGHVLLLENDEEAATVVCEMLTAAGLKVIWLVDGSTALDQLDLLQPIVILMAWPAPDETCVLLLQYLREHQADPHPPLVLFLGETPVDPALTEQVAAVLPKPLDPQLLLTKLQSLCATSLKEGDRPSP
ncbi:circadian input-output histidine kinase CikA [Synechococcus elongatus]|uniref:circadian input-output histidine kinase CikA n=1 Tax=Synechococcus elongatus TaxID=32046 RepID=UPI0012A82AA2|nr:GAF domain-containing protein [Synechococcus elongatus PCC 11802]